MLSGPSWVILLPLSGVDKLLGEPLAVIHVVAAAAPQPVPRQVSRSSSAAAAAGGQLALTARPADGVDHAGCTDGICERRFPGACRTATWGIRFEILTHLFF